MMKAVTIPKRFHPYLSFIPTLALLAGLIFDIFTLDRPDALFENAVVLGYLTLSAIVTVALQSAFVAENEYRRLLFLGIVQFSFGNLASALLVLYSRSGTFVGSAIFLGILALLFLGNEFLKSRYARAHLRVVIWFVLLLTYSTLIIPVLVNSISTWVFMLSVLVALAITGILMFIMRVYATDEPSRYLRRMQLSVIGVTICFVLLYITNAIPPVPLALKHIGIYHHITREGSTYLAAFEEPTWYAFWRDTNHTFKHQPGSDAFCFSSVFAPPGLATDIQHHWEVYDPRTESWQTVARIPFTITGGRDEGFRGYTQTGQIQNGRWRCSVETARGVLIGRETFIVEDTDDTADTTTIRL